MIFTVVDYNTLFKVRYLLWPAGGSNSSAGGAEGGKKGRRQRGRGFSEGVLLWKQLNFSQLFKTLESC